MIETKYGPYSPSRLNTAECPYRFKKQYIEKSVQDSGSAASKRGNVVHETFEEITKGWLRNEPLTWEPVMDILAKKMAQYEVILHEDQQLCIGASHAYMNKPPHGLEHCMGTEEHLAIKWVDEELVECNWGDKDCYARGKIDLLMIDGNYARIIDHKTQPFIETANTFQMGFYAWLVTKIYPYITTVDTTLHFCRPELDFYSKSFRWEACDIKDIETEIHLNIATIEGMEEHNTISSHHCNYCPISLECPEVDRLNSLGTKYGKMTKGPLLTAQEAQEAASAYNVVEKNKEIVRKKLQDFAKEIGSVVIPGREFGYKATDSYKVYPKDKKKMFELLESQGLDPFDFVEFPVPKLKSLWKYKSEVFLNKLKGLVTPTKSTKFGSRKI